MKKNNNLVVGQRFQSGLLFRAAAVDSFDVEKRTVKFSFSSENPVQTEHGFEILDHDPKSVRLTWLASGNAPFLADHKQDVLIGIVESAEIGADRKGWCVVRFGKGALADSYFQDYVDGIRKNISFGYLIHKVVLQESIGDGSKRDIYRVIDWEPYEVSLVSVPADVSVGVGRSAQEKTTEVEVIGNENEEEKKEENEEEINNNKQNKGENMTEKENKVDVVAVQKEARDTETQRVRSIEVLAGKYGERVKDIKAVAESYINDGKPVESLRQYILENLDDKKSIRAINDDGKIGMSDKEAKKFSFLRALVAASEKDWSLAPLEKEVIDATRKKYGERKWTGNIQIPVDVLIAGNNGDPEKSTRSLNASNGAEGGYMVGTQLRGDSFIEMLRNRLVVKQAGAFVMSGLVGNVDIPRQNGGGTFYWLGEGDDVTDSTQATGMINLTPKTGAAKTKITRKMLLQATPDAEMFVKNDLIRVAATGIDLAALKGSGTANQPRGILNTTGVNTVTITSGTPTFQKMVDMETAVAADNADIGSLTYLANAAGRGYMKQNPKFTNSEVAIWEKDEVNGYRALATNQLANNEIIFGNFADLIIGEWGVLDISTDPYTNGDSGGLIVRVFQDVDVGLRHPESFCMTVL